MIELTKTHAIGIIGAGKIVTNAHLPSYAAGDQVKVLALADQNPQVLTPLAERYAIPLTFTNYHELLKVPEIEVVDIAVPANCHRQVVLDALAAGKHILCQKPLSDTWDDAVAMAAAAKQCGLILAVNQNARWIPSYRRCGELIRQGKIGEPMLTIFEDHYWTDHHPYELEQDRFLLLKNTIHKVDAIRSWLNAEPITLSAHTTKTTTHPALGESQVTMVLGYASGHVVTLIDDGASSSPGFRRILIQGTEGALRLDDTTLEFFKKKPGERSQWQPVEITGKRVPDAFYGSLTTLLAAIERGKQPEHNADDNLKSLRLIFAAYESAASGRTIDLTKESPCK
ncbi:Gfo/Idh/MocA family protein [Syntrophorhabdus aromaticivorans]|uniref:Gfo/Idh/MocA family oxidoreductase n=1 Tax=Syntrophorhabdus aromaticivorans TaxID=328301 RepID=A0A971M4L6_9BACT|nr:Gfo/Idh/MocA family oxidoreductase [Syntrophorhabdus aromaticivorans]NLW35669.1 Gfo/Idh/MocA family oxidoreductase [Syntrophorhabdus aromaticivorans]